MNEESSRNLSADQKLDLILKEMRSMNERITTLEAKSYDTRPIWERALAEILEVKAEVSAIRERLSGVEGQLTHLNKEMRRLDRSQDVLNQAFFRIQVDWREVDEHVLELEQKAERPPA